MHRNYIQRLRLTAGKICTVVILGLPTTESVRLRWGQLLVKLNLNPKLIFMTLSPSIFLISMINKISIVVCGEEHRSLRSAFVPAKPKQSLFWPLFPCWDNWGERIENNCLFLFLIRSRCKYIYWLFLCHFELLFQALKIERGYFLFLLTHSQVFIYSNSFFENGILSN